MSVDVEKYHKLWISKKNTKEKELEKASFLIVFIWISKGFLRKEFKTIFTNWSMICNSFDSMCT